MDFTLSGAPSRPRGARRDLASCGSRRGRSGRTGNSQRTLRCSSLPANDPSAGTEGKVDGAWRVAEVAMALSPVCTNYDRDGFGDFRLADDDASRMVWM